MGIADGQLNTLPPIPPRALWARPRPLPFPFDQPGCRLYDRGRNALWDGLPALGLEAGDELLMPAYHCGAEVGPVVSRGIVPRFWAGGADLAPVEAELEALLGPRTRGLYLTHFLGFPQDAARWRRWCDERGLLLLEDAAPAWPAHRGGRALGSWGDLAIHAPWKTFGLSDAATLLCASAPPPIPGRRGEPRELAKPFVRWLGQRLAPIGALRRRRSGQSGAGGNRFDPRREFGVHDPARGISTASLALLRRLCDEDVAAARRRNFEWLLERLGERVPTPFREVPDGACPAEFPLEAEDRDGLLAHLAARGIGAIAFWSIPHPACPPGSHPGIDRRRARTATLPVHQGLRRRDLERLARAVEEWPNTA